MLLKTSLGGPKKASVMALLAPRPSKRIKIAAVEVTMEVEVAVTVISLRRKTAI